MKEPKNSLVKQYKTLLQLDNVELEFEEEINPKMTVRIIKNMNK